MQHQLSWDNKGSTWVTRHQRLPQHHLSRGNKGSTRVTRHARSRPLVVTLTVVAEEALFQPSSTPASTSGVGVWKRLAVTAPASVLCKEGDKWLKKRRGRRRRRRCLRIEERLASRGGRCCICTCVCFSPHMAVCNSRSAEGRTAGRMSWILFLFSFSLFSSSDRTPGPSPSSLASHSTRTHVLSLFLLLSFRLWFSPSDRMPGPSQSSLASHSTGTHFLSLFLLYTIVVFLMHGTASAKGS